MAFPHHCCNPFWLAVLGSTKKQNSWAETITFYENACLAKAKIKI
jgi:hypothetical protein